MLVFGACAGTASTTAFLAGRRSSRRSGRRNGLTTRRCLRLVDGRIEDCAPELQQEIDANSGGLTSQGLHNYFGFRFAGLTVNFPELTEDGTAIYRARQNGDEGLLRVTVKGSVTTVEITDKNSGSPVSDHVARYRDYMRDTCLWILEQTLHPTWLTNRDGILAWGNRAYREIARAAGQSRSSDPVIPAFEATGDAAEREQRRVRFDADDGPDRWFDVTVNRAGGMHLYQATDVTPVVRGEAARRDFIQTLTKTFAQLSIGLAIFDRHRRLALFNPALIDLTSLNAEFLSRRPDHLTFFDSLRDGMIMPEPRNYPNWRDRIFEVISAAENGSYQETWTLPNGSTYRVTGRPHPNGAVAFLFEDISAEITLTRRFREQIELSQSAMEAVDDALAVFSPQGVLSYTNSAYRDLWQLPANEAALDHKVSDVSRLWQERCDPDPVWGEFRDFAVGFEERHEWDARVQMRDGRPLECRFRPLQGGATLALFRVAQSTPLREIRRAP